MHLRYFICIFSTWFAIMMIWSSMVLADSGMSFILLIILSLFGKLSRSSLATSSMDVSAYSPSVNLPIPHDCQSTSEASRVPISLYFLLELFACFFPTLQHGAYHHACRLHLTVSSKWFYHYILNITQTQLFLQRHIPLSTQPGTSGSPDHFFLLDMFLWAWMIQVS